MKRLTLNSAFFILDATGIYGAITTSGWVRVVAIIASALLTVWFFLYVWRFFKMLKVWMEILKDQYKIPWVFLYLFLREVWLIPNETDDNLIVSCDVISCLLKDVEIEHAKLVIQIPSITTGYLEIPIVHTTEIPYYGRIKKLKPTTLLKSKKFSLSPDDAKALNNLYKTGTKRLDMTAQLIGIVKGKEAEIKELCRSTYFTARVLDKRIKNEV